MKKKLTLHFFITLCLALITLACANILAVYWRSYQFRTHSEEYEYGEHFINQLVQELNTYLVLQADGSITFTDDGKKRLDEHDIKLQILNEANEVVYQYHQPDYAKSAYSSADLIRLYRSEDQETLFINEKTLDNQTYTSLLFFPPETVRRYLFLYNTQEMMTTHHIPTFITLNITITLILSLISAQYLSRPLSGMIQNILSLAKGQYPEPSPKPSLYHEVEQSIAHLSHKLKANEQERQKMDSIREEWITNITHDIKTPLTSIRGNAEILSDPDYVIDVNSRIKFASVIVHKSDYLKTVIDDLNLSTRLKNKQFLLHKTPINLVSLLRQVVIDFINDPNFKHHDIQFKYSDEYLPYEMDELLMKRVFSNLITNALTHNEHPVQIQIDIKQIHNRIVITIADNGKGIHEDELDHIFNRYYRGTNTTRATQGSGLGLAIAHDIIERHQGIITASSQPGHGLTITITL